jgi:hypothetical protein
VPLDAPKESRDPGTAAERAVRCNRCNHALTSTRERIEVEGKHAHSFVNPSGILFHVVCYRAVDGARVEGTPESFTSWFAGTAWVYALCAQCTGHVGWSYVHLHDGDRFFALIEDCIAIE